MFNVLLMTGHALGGIQNGQSRRVTRVAELFGRMRVARLFEVVTMTVDTRILHELSIACFRMARTASELNLIMPVGRDAREQRRLDARRR
jgi:hypothetical protein